MDWNTILANAKARHNLDTVRALRAELAGWAMAKAGANKDAQLHAAERLTAAERAIDTVLAKIGRGDEQEAAQIRLAATAETERARAVLEPIGKAAASGSMSPSDRMSLGHAQTAVG